MFDKFSNWTDWLMKIDIKKYRWFLKVKFSNDIFKQENIKRNFWMPKLILLAF